MDSKSVMNATAGVLKKGPWTTAEDAILMEYVRKHGEGNWNSVQKNSGLMRCGKSCRLRWANHLRPNLKKGSFSAAEERVIIDLHSKFGNKWARMASQLPGRTDNEIKNFWNTRMKRRQRAGLPIYPQQLHENSTTIHHQQEHHEQKHPNPSPFSSFRKPAYNLPPPFLDSITFTPTFTPLQNNFHNSSFYSNPTLQFKSFLGPNSTNDLSLPLSPVPHPSSLSSFHSFTDQSVPTKTPLMCYNFDNNNVSFTSLIMDDQGQNGLVPELPSNQTPPPPPCPNTDFSVGVFFGNNEMKEPEIQGENRSSGLLDTLVMESRNLALKEKMNGEDLVGMLDKGKRKMDEKEEEEDDEKESSKRARLSSTNSGVASATNLSCEDITSSQSSIGTKPSEEAMEEMNSMDDDLLTLLDNFPSMTPLPEWYRTKNLSEGMSTGDIVQEVEPQQDDSSARADETRNVEWGLGSSSSSFWDNMPSIY